MRPHISSESFGKGTVQELIPVDNGAMVKLTVAHWITPLGHQIDKFGIQPDIQLTTDTSTPVSQTSPDAWAKAAAQQINK